MVCGKIKRISGKEQKAIRIYIADYKALGIEKTWEGLLPFFSDAEKEKILRFKFEEDRIRSVVGRCLIRAGVRREYPDGEITIDTTESGKPFIGDRRGYEFNLSHSGRIIAFAEDTESVGVDVELVKDKDWRIFHRYLTDAEMSMIGSSKDPKACFFEVWTVREAFAKEEGLGLKILDMDFAMDYESRSIFFDGRTLKFRSFEHKADERYSISVCSPHEIPDVGLTELNISDWEQCLKEGLFFEHK